MNSLRPDKILAASITAALASVLAVPASAQIAGDASDYNVFVFGSFDSTGSDAEGNIAAGGNVSLSGYQVAADIAGTNASPNPARLVVGGNLTAGNGSVGSNEDGSIYVAGTTSLPTLTSGGAVQPQNVIASFSADQTKYTNLSTSLDGLAANGTTSGLLPGNTLDFTGTSKGLNVFDVSGSTLSQSEAINISAPVGSTVLINVTGTSAVSFTNGSVSETGVSASSVLYNIASASSVNLDLNNAGKDPEGSILAPLAAVTGYDGVMTGQLIAKSFSGPTQFDSALFTGNLSPVAEPATAWLLLAGVGGLVGFSRASRSRLAPARG